MCCAGHVLCLYPQICPVTCPGAPLLSALELGLTCFEGVGFQTRAHTLYQVALLTVSGNNKFLSVCQLLPARTLTKVLCILCTYY